MLIKSKDNQKIKLVKSLESKKARDTQGLYIIENIKLINEAIDEKLKFEYILISENVSKKEEIICLLEKIDSNNIEHHYVDNSIFKEITSTVTSQGIVGVAKKIKYDFDNIINNSNFVVFCDKLQDPGNLGTIIRTTDAFGPCTVILSPCCVDVYNDKTVRACAGSLLRVPVLDADDSINVINKLKNKGFCIISTVVDSSKSFDDIINPKKICLVIGNEGNGVSKEVKDVSDECITIKMTGQTESLNASIAAAISIYEIRKKLL